MNRRALYDKCLRREPLSRAEAYALYEACPLQEIASLADRVRRATVQHPQECTCQIDRNIKITNDF